MSDSDFDARASVSPPRVFDSPEHNSQSSQSVSSQDNSSNDSAAERRDNADEDFDPLDRTKFIPLKFKEHFASRKAYEEAEGSWDPDSDDASLAIPDEILKAWVEILFAAFINTKGVPVRKKVGYATERLGGNTYFKPILIEMKCWEIVVCNKRHSISPHS